MKKSVFIGIIIGLIILGVIGVIIFLNTSHFLSDFFTAFNDVGTFAIEEPFINERLNGLISNDLGSYIDISILSNANENLTITSTKIGGCGTNSEKFNLMPRDFQSIRVDCNPPLIQGKKIFEDVIISYTSGESKIIKKAKGRIVNEEVTGAFAFFPDSIFNPKSASFTSKEIKITIENTEYRIVKIISTKIEDCGTSSEDININPKSSQSIGIVCNPPINLNLDLEKRPFNSLELNITYLSQGSSDNQEARAGIHIPRNFIMDYPFFPEKVSVNPNNIKIKIQNVGYQSRFEDVTIISTEIDGCGINSSMLNLTYYKSQVIEVDCESNLTLGEGISRDVIISYISHDNSVIKKAQGKIIEFIS